MTEREARKASAGLRGWNAVEAGADRAGIPLWVATTQPSIAGQTPAVIAQKLDQRNRVLARFGSHALDFWTPLADSGGSGLAARSLIQLYDDNHPNAEGHRRLFDQVVAARIHGAPAALRRNHAATRLAPPARKRSGSPRFFRNGRWSSLNGSTP